ncbi:MAG: SsrA-binding protein SmpB [Acidobacteriota bacterium]
MAKCGAGWGGENNVEGKKRDSAIKILSDNRQASHLYSLSDRMEAGLVLTGTEVKAARDGKIQLKDAFGEVQNNEAWLMNVHIGQYSHGNIMNHEPVRRRKLLLHRSEIKKLQETTREKGLTVVPTKLYLKHGLVKVELAVGKGKKLHDKRESERNREMESEARAAMSRRRQ